MSADPSVKLPRDSLCGGLRCQRCTGYPAVGLWLNGKRVLRGAHILVMEVSVE